MEKKVLCAAVFGSQAGVTPAALDFPCPASRLGQRCLRAYT